MIAIYSIRHRGSPDKAAERDIQDAFFRLCALHYKTYPETLWIFHIPNGAHLPRKRSVSGAWYCPEMTRLKRAGLRVGMVDCVWPYARGDYVGMAWEFKRPGARVTPAQSEWLDWFAGQRWKTGIYYSAIEAWEAVKAYYRLGAPNDAVEHSPSETD